MSKYANKQFWIDTFDRAVATFSQAAVAALTADAIPGLLDMDLTAVLSVSGLAAAVSVLTSVAFRGTTNDTAAVVMAQPSGEGVTYKSGEITITGPLTANGSGTFSGPAEPEH
ncbi:MULTISPECIES: holin [unclassified Microbacterium]|uniref:holin n=1 Tax=unclassified Microbacterium TaxID=2609290 RepID=UPI000EA8D3FD|nr:MULTISPECIES: holin [unclassified Microbacterium]MBT2485823.1 holin [Microbacterium sp. ISL-108]RKN68586.1 hypothetical protein D7252_13995 [Microbacterium sp. CGR2]